MKKLIFVAFMCFAAQCAYSQSIKIVAGKTDTVQTSTHYLRGLTEADAKIFVGGREFAVYNTGAFAAEVKLKEGDNVVEIVAKRGNAESKESLNIFYKKRQARVATEKFEIEKIEIFPQGNLILSEGDILRVRVKAKPNCKVTWLDGEELHELPLSESDVAGIYQASYIVKNNDEKFKNPIKIKLSSETNTVEKTLDAEIKFIDKNSAPIMLRTKGDLPYLNYGLGTDRLGGSKIGHIVEGITLRGVGKIGNLYKVQLSKNYQAYIPESCVDVVSNGVFVPQSLVGSWTARGNGNVDIVNISLTEKLPFKTFHEINPNRIIVDIFGATANTAWLTQYPETWRAIKSLNYEQIEEDVFRVKIELANNHWGHSVSYNGTSLAISVKPQPNLSLSGMHIALDAGHGGVNPGARGTTGCLEKELNFDFVMKLKSALEKKGARVTLTRDSDVDIATSARLVALRKINPDILISVHCNAGGSPFTGKGTSTYYRHIGFRPLASSILKRLLELDVKNFGEVGSFNFTLNSATEYPNVLVETLFLSSPEDEAKLLDEKFRQKLVNKIISGLEDYIKSN